MGSPQYVSPERARDGASTRRGRHVVAGRHALRRRRGPFSVRPADHAGHADRAGHQPTRPAAARRSAAAGALRAAAQGAAATVHRVRGRPAPAPRARPQRQGAAPAAPPAAPVRGQRPTARGRADRRARRRRQAPVGRARPRRRIPRRPLRPAARRDRRRRRPRAGLRDRHRVGGHPRRRARPVGAERRGRPPRPGPGLPRPGGRGRAAALWRDGQPGHGDWSRAARCPPASDSICCRSGRGGPDDDQGFRIAGAGELAGVPGRHDGLLPRARQQPDAERRTAAEADQESARVLEGGGGPDQEGQPHRGVRTRADEPKR